MALPGASGAVTAVAVATAAGTIELAAVQQGALLPLHLSVSASLAAHPGPVQVGPLFAVLCRRACFASVRRPLPDASSPQRRRTCKCHMCAGGTRRCIACCQHASRLCVPVVTAGPALAWGHPAPCILQQRKGVPGLQEHAADHRRVRRRSLLSLRRTMGGGWGLECLRRMFVLWLGH